MLKVTALKRVYSSLFFVGYSFRILRRLFDESEQCFLALRRVSRGYRYITNNLRIRSGHIPLYDSKYQALGLASGLDRATQRCESSDGRLHWTLLGVCIL